MSGGIGLTRTIVSRRELQVTGQGLITETAPRDLYANTTALVSGTVYCGLVGFKSGDVVTNVHFMFSTGFSGFSGVGALAGLYSSAGTKLAASADGQALLAAAGFKTFPLSTPYTITTDGAYYLAFIALTSSPGNFYRVTTSAIAANQNIAVGTGVIPHGVMASQTDLPSSVTLSTTNSFGPWMGAS